MRPRREPSRCWTSVPRDEEPGRLSPYLDTIWYPADGLPGHQAELGAAAYPELAPDIDFGSAEFLNGKLFSRFRKKGHVRPDVAVKLRTHDGDPQFGIFHGEFEGKLTGAMEKRLRMYFHHIALKYDDPPVIAAVFFKKGGGPKAVETKEVVRQMKSWVGTKGGCSSVAALRSV